MKAAIAHAFKQPFSIETVPDPSPAAHGVVVRVHATGVCRSDWHMWMGHWPEIDLPLVPGHEIAGEVAAIGKEVRRWRVGDRVTLPFVCGCGICQDCQAGDQHVCGQQFQPGYSAWGSFAEYAAIHYADVNLVHLPETIDDVTAASLGCRFATAFRAIVDQAAVSAGQWVAVHGCGGVGLSAVMIASALGANVVAVDIKREKLDFARTIGAVAVVNAAQTDRVIDAVREITHGGAHASIDALGSPVTCFNSISNLRKRGRHVQVGLLLGDDLPPALPMGKIVGDELEIRGSHGMQAHRYAAMLAMIETGKLAPEKLIGKVVSLEEGLQHLIRMDRFEINGVTVINAF
jgi:alcohol dehydrogenase